MQSTALAVLAAIGAMAVPAQAQDADQQDRQDRQDRQEMPSPTPQERFERQAAAPEQRAERQAQRVERQAQRAEMSQRAESQPATAPQDSQAAGGGRAWNRGGTSWQGRGEARQQQEVRQQQGGASPDIDRQARILARQQERAAAAQQPGSGRDDGWRSQRAPDSQRYGRNWDNSGAVTRPAPADNAAIPSVPQRGSDQQWRGRGEARNGADWANRRNRTYSDPNRTGRYQGDGYRTDENWRNRSGDRTVIYRNGRSADNYRDRRDQNYAYRDGYNGGYNSSGRDHRQWDRNDWRRDNRYNWSGYRTQHRDLFRAGRYYSPYNNYSYSRLSIGFFLNSGFYGQNYWISDPYQYRLPEVYGPYRWVRYYDDVLLVDIYSGEVVDVIHDFFW